MGEGVSKIACINPGSSSLRYSVYAVDAEGEREILGRHVGGLDASNMAAFEKAVAAALDEIAVSNPDAIGYRLVHGGHRFSAPVEIDDVVTGELRELIPMAPLHLPAAIDCIGLARRRFPQLRHVACFDTAFHHPMPELAKRFALPEEYWDKGLRRYGFHGLSFAHVVETLGDELPSRVIIAHLGSGSSLVALLDGRPMDTTMGLTPTGGMMMGSRSGDLDPGVIIGLLRDGGLDVGQLERLLNQESGLKAVSGISSDMQQLLEMSDQSPAAAMAVQMYCYHARKWIGALAAVLGGLDLLVFTGGIGENSQTIRDRIGAGLEFLDCETKVVPSDEARMIARSTARVLSEDRA
ncbi:MAG: acetate kinase [Verrucomicrobiales bacterium]|jgi:acetate kinase